MRKTKERESTDYGTMFSPKDNFGQLCDKCKKGQYVNDYRTGQLKCSDCGDPKNRWSV